ncbi:MAG: hypothetical protein HC904_11255 [Blastochloris sp.]|nr:hypothetical protein [Blastochloris sp.]
MRILLLFTLALSCLVTLLKIIQTLRRPPASRNPSSSPYDLKSRIQQAKPAQVIEVKNVDPK